eukprot:2363214-Pyramimonas_sp.AAC.1
MLSYLDCWRYFVRCNFREDGVCKTRADIDDAIIPKELSNDGLHLTRGGGYRAYAQCVKDHVCELQLRRPSLNLTLDGCSASATNR